jgi:hypothetical protein
VAELEDGYLFQGSLSWQTTSGINSVDVNPFDLKLEAGGQVVSLEDTAPDQVPTFSGAACRPWAVRTNRKDLSGPWKLTAPSLEIYQAVEVPFQVDFGPDPHPGQVWQLDQKIEVAGHILHALSASLSKVSEGVLSVSINFESDPAVQAVGLSMPDNTPAPSSGGGGGGGGGAQPSQLTSEFSVGKNPTGVRKIVIRSISFILAGPWQVIWQPPLNSTAAGPTSTPINQACLNDETWQQIKKQAPPQPDIPGGSLLLEEFTGQLMPQMSLINPDGSGQKVLGIGGWSSLSPDGSTVAFIKSNGPMIFLQDTHNGEIRPLSGTADSDYHPLWSPDGRWIAFVRSNDGIYIIHPDGSGLKALTPSKHLTFLAGWMPDSRRLVITTLGAQGSQVQLLDIDSGKLEDGFIINQRKGGNVQVSPDGKRLSFSETAFGQMSYNVFVSNPDGSARRAVAGFKTLAASATTWSPDGKWLAVSVVEEVNGNEVYSSILVQPDTCQLVLLPNLHGNINSWLNSR